MLAVFNVSQISPSYQVTSTTDSAILLFRSATPIIFLCQTSSFLQDHPQKHITHTSPLARFANYFLS